MVSNVKRDCVYSKKPIRNIKIYSDVIFHTAMHLKKKQICFQAAIKETLCLLRNKALDAHGKSVKSLILPDVN